MRRPGNTFVPDGKSRRDTAVLLVGTAAEFGLSDQHVFAVQRGFYISDELVAVLYAEGMPINNGVETGPQSDEIVVDEIVSGNGAEIEEIEEDGDDLYDPADYTISDIVTFVTEQDDAEFAQGVLDAEEAGRNRGTLVKWLTEFIEASGNRAEENNTTTSEEE